MQSFFIGKSLIEFGNVGHSTLRRLASEEGTPTERWLVFDGSHNRRASADCHISPEECVREHDCGRQRFAAAAVEVPIRAQAVHETLDGDCG
jgi:hypothetical protein